MAKLSLDLSAVTAVGESGGVKLKRNTADHLSERLRPV
jgi:hypothetical protein